jgi:hypothetical protein
MSWNVKVATFVVGATTFNAEAAGVGVEGGSAAGPRLAKRIEVTPWGAVHDMDGTDDGKLIWPQVWNDFVFYSATSAQHTQYENLMALVGKHGTLTVKIRTASTTIVKTATARQMPVPEDAQWTAPFVTNAPNWLMVRGVWQLKSGWTVV